MLQLSIFPALVPLLPWNFVKNRLLLPTTTFIHRSLSFYGAKTAGSLYSVRDWVIRTIIVTIVVILLLSLSVLMYLAFYYAYVPTISHVQPLHFTFKPCNHITEGDCLIMRYPTAEVVLGKEKLRLMLGQPYKISVEVEMPESPSNKQLGMFMICANLFSKQSSFQNVFSKQLIRHSCRSSMLHYRSDFLHYMKMLMMSPLFLIGSWEEKQSVFVDLFSNYIEDEDTPVSEFEIQIQSATIEFYSGKLLINAYFTGLRYFMFHWPLISAVIGISLNLFFTTIISLVSWYQLIHSDEYNNYRLNISQELSFVDADVDVDEHDFSMTLTDEKNETLKIIETPDSTEC